MQWDWHALYVGLGGSVMDSNVAGREMKCAAVEGGLLLRLRSNARRGGTPQ
jgi:hypothetical protein